MFSLAIPPQNENTFGMKGFSNHLIISLLPIHCSSRYSQQVCGLCAWPTVTLGYFWKKQDFERLSTNMVQYHRIYMPIKRLQRELLQATLSFEKISVVLANTQRVLSLVQEGLL